MALRGHARGVAEAPIPRRLDVKGFVCPLPVFRAKKAICEVPVGQVLEVLATDPTTKTDIPDWVRRDGHELLAVEDSGSDFRFLVRRLH